jgi:hypothetical protein
MQDDLAQLTDDSDVESESDGESDSAQKSLDFF